ncbi:flagellar assembly protein FliW [Desulfovibrio porci]|uniref:flagellar assembly protein FliW n=1 Tax=Desulfovibrio porci TaxID=2605782 RepID=UPI003A8F6250
MGNNTRLAINTRIGPREIDPDRTIHFPCGLVGLESEKEFALLQIHQNWPLLILQSVTTPAVGLMVADPYSFIDSYPVQMGEAEKALLGLDAEEKVAVLVTVSRPADQPDAVALNLCGPICINYRLRLGLQIPQPVDLSRLDKFFRPGPKPPDEKSGGL